MPTCGTIVPLRRAQKCPLNRIRRSHIAQLRSYDFLFRSHKRQMRSEKATLLPCPWGDKHLYILLKFRKFCPTRPVRAKALKYRAIYKAVALTGRIADCHYTQGAALG